MLLFTSLFTSGSFPTPPGGGAGSIALVNGGFETGDFTGWELVTGSGWQVAQASTTPNSDPRSGTYYARVSGSTARIARRQTFDLLASGLTEGEIGAGTLTLNFSAWIGGEDGVNDGGRLRVNYLEHATIQAATNGVIAFRNRAIDEHRIGAVTRDTLDRANALVSIAYGAEFPLSGLHLRRLEHTRDGLCALLKAEGS